MNDEKVLTHPAFDRPPVLNARRRGPTPRGIAMIRRERFERGYAKQKAQQIRQRTAQLERFIYMAEDIADEVGPLIQQVGTGTEHAAYLILRQALQQAADISGALVRGSDHG
ncbi:hypothetical protein PWP93_04770 [Paraburkholderia sp. A1RI-2L]|uniref:hypothetical protein n=1 Tax=Paraburkholderia sp. A1RI-2L TaxID=3028367 RepID=UPI003B7C259A